MHNPLIPEILSLLRHHSEGMSEYELMQHCSEHGLFEHLVEESQLALFQKHFMIMNALYELQFQLWQDEKLYLEVSPLKVQLVTLSDNSEETAMVIAETEKLSEYYRDWNNFEETDEQGVTDLLSSFWQRFASVEKREEAFKILELDAGAKKQQIIDSYRRLAAMHHPDKGGDQERFIRVRQAYETLKISP